MITTKEACRAAILSFAITALTIASYTQGWAQQASVSIGTTDIGGVVTGANGPEAGVWVIAETTDLPTKYAKIVVTDDQGRYLIPDLPKANYSVWVRGYGLVDSPKVQAAPGKTCRPDGGAGAECGGGGAVLSADLLVLDAARARRRTNSRCAQDQEPGRVAEHRQERRLPVLPSRSARRARAPCRRSSATSFRSRPKPGRGAAVGQRAGVHGARHRPPRHRAALDLFGDWTDRIAGRRTAVRQARAAARASSATS